MPDRSATERLETRLFVGGKFVPAASGATFTTYEPATGGVLTEVAKAGPADVDAAAQAARRAFDAGPWPRMNPFDRGRVLQRIADGILADAARIAEIETRNSGKTIANSLNEVEASARVFAYYAGAMDKFFGTTIPLGANLLDFTLREPVGVVAQITPWNFPFMAAAWKVAPALAAGCAVLLKPASATPLTALMLAEVAAAVGLPEGVLNVLPGPGRDLGAVIARHPAIDKIAFTGETTTGAELQKLAADSMKRVSLELGGKSPNIVFADCDIAKAASQAVKGGFGNAGQSCSARTRVLVERTCHDAFVAAFLDATRKFKVGDPMARDTEMGPLISTGHWDTVKRHVERGRADGATLLCGGDRPDGLARGSYFAPTIFTGVSNDTALAREEIFGPVVAVIPFDTEAEAVALANANDYGLNGSVWTRDINRALRVVKAVRSGMLSVNSHGSASRYGLFAPFGGFKKSGIGRELGMQALELYTELKNVFIDLED